MTSWSSISSPGRVGQAWRNAGGGEQIDEPAAAGWVESRLLGFAVTYLRLQACSSPAQGDAAVDPVCGMLIKKADAKGL